METRPGMKANAWLQGAGCGVLLALESTAHLLSPDRQDLFTHLFPLSSVYVGALVELISLSIVAALVWGKLDRLVRSSLLWVFVLAGVVSFEVHDLAVLHLWGSFHWTLGLFAGLVLLGLGLRQYRLRWFEGAIRLVRGSVLLVGFSALWMIPELAYLAVRSSTHEAPRFYAKPAISNNPTSSRIVWLLFDELSQDQTSEHRWAGLDLPNFDRLRSESVTFTDVLPVGYFTKNVIPSLLLGRHILQTRSSAAGELDVYIGDEQQWRPFDASKTIFADARRLGWTTGIAGWNQPYCRIMAGSVDSCFWSHQQPFPADMDPRRGVFFNATVPLLPLLRKLAPQIVSQIPTSDTNSVVAHQRDYQSVMEAAQALIRDSTIRFAYIHVGVPHPPAIYDRKSRRFSSGGSYIDNLALADEALGTLLHAIEGTPAWSNTTVIVSGDHSWRVSYWRGEPGWTREDDAASRGHFDPRPVLSIHLPHEWAGSQVTHPFPESGLHEVIESLLRGQIRSADELIQWTHRSGTIDHLMSSENRAPESTYRMQAMSDQVTGLPSRDLIPADGSACCRYSQPR
jgi:hypothetical protein